MNYLKHKSLFALRLVLMMLFAGVLQKNAQAQNLVSGTVTDSSGQPLSGVSVQVKNTAKGTTTNELGTYSINAISTDILVFSYVGYQPQELTVGNRSTVDINLSSSAATLTDVVVIGYGTANKRDLTGSITTVTGKEIQDKPNSNPVSSLQGKVTGLSVVTNGTPGAQPDIRIRGTASLGQVNPLYVVDGILNDNIDFLNPNDIERIEILKDPSSLAIFGVRGATGAIVITTKKAKAGQTIITFAPSYGFKTLVDKIDMANAAEFDLLFKEENDNNGVPTPDYSALTANTDWIDAVTRTGQFSNNSLSVAASSEKNRFNLALGYIYDEGIIRREKLQRMTLAINDEFKVSKWLKLGFGLTTARSNKPYDATQVLDQARKVMPHIDAGTKQFRVQNPYGTDTITQNIYSGLAVALQSAGVINPILQLENTWNKQVNNELRNVGNVYAEFNFLKHFTFRSTFYADMSTVDFRQYSPLYYAYDPMTETPYLYNQQTQVVENNQTYKKFQQDQILTYINNFGDHSITGTAGFTTYYNGVFARGGTSKPANTPGALPIPDDERFWYINNGFQANALTLATSNQSEATTVSVLGRVLYNFQRKYYLNASFRNDASSRMLKENRNQQFWSVGGAWEISREDFMADQNIFDYLKLKGSVGVLGNQSAVDNNNNSLAYPAYPYLASGSAAVFGTNIFNAARDAYQANPDLHWETIDAWEVGVELNAFDNRLHFEGTYFNRTTNELMTFVDRSTVGLPPELINGGSIRNWGEEFLASWTQSITKDLSISISGNITFLQNKVLSLSEELPTGVLIRGFTNNGAAESRTQAGHPIASFYGYIQEGVFQTYADILKSPSQASLGEIVPGVMKFRDLNGDNVIDANDRTFIGNPSPDFMYGTSITITYKGIGLSVDGAGVYGNEVFRTWNSLESPFQRVNYADFQLDRWHGPGTSNVQPLVSARYRANFNGSTYNIEDGSYFRIRNIQLYYNFPTGMLSAIHVKGLRAYANVQNLKTWKNNLGYTAEFGGDATAFGYDFAGGAIPAVYTFGLNVTF